MSFFSYAGNIIVNNTNDSGTGSLRSAVSMAGNGDTIRFNTNLISGGSSTILLTAHIEFSKDLVIKGLYNSTDTLFLSGGGANRIFSIIDTVSYVTLDSLVLINGSETSGGAISFDNIEHLRILNSVVRNNVATSNRGGALASYVRLSTEITIDNTIFSNNTAALNGGGIYIYALEDRPIRINVSNSTFQYNSSGESGGAIDIASDSVFSNISNTTISFNDAATGGGGLSSSGETLSKVEITKSTISNNTSGSIGGGIASTSGSSTNAFSYVTILKSTITGNVSSLSNPYGSSGGGIYSSSRISIVSITNSTITGNNANLGGGVMSYSLAYYFPTIEMKSSVIALNGANNIKGYSLTSSLGYNIFSDATIDNSVASDQLNVDAVALNLQPLTFNGGDNKTMLPLYPSVAINKGDPLDNSNAQNSPVLGLRDVGAAESVYSCEVTGVETVTACISYTWIDGVTYTYDNNTAVDTLVTLAGCDSIITLNLTINTVDLLIGAYGPGLFAGASNATFRWMNCADSSIIAGETNQTFIPTSNGDYAVEVTQNGCVDTSNCLSVNTIGLNEEQLDQILIYPNPTQNQLTIETKSNDSHLAMYNTIGELVYSIAKLRPTTVINVSHLPSGIYTVFVGGDNYVVKKIVIN